MKKGIALILILLLITVTGTACMSILPDFNRPANEELDREFNQYLTDNVINNHVEEVTNYELINEVLQMIEDSDFDIDLESAARKNNMTIEEFAERLKRRFEAWQNES